MAYPRDGGVVEGDRDERGAGGGLGGEGERQRQEEGEGGRHRLGGTGKAPARELISVPYIWPPAKPDVPSPPCACLAVGLFAQA